jgi:YfiR/HmsC-like
LQDASRIKKVMRKALFRLLVGAAIGLGPLVAGLGGAWAQASAASESAVKAAFLYKFAAFVDWPPRTFQAPDQPLVIGVSGNEDVAADLEQLLAARQDARPVSVRRVPEGAPASGVHILFIATRRDAQLREAIAAVKGPVLIVTEQPSGLQLGGVLNFSSGAGRVRFSASLSSAERRGLKLSARLLAVAQAVEGNPR